ncbi:MAG: outer membrane protein assembly factor BamD [Candidatus Aminicenantales bacterium]
MQSRWKEVSEINSIEAYEKFLQRYPEDRFSNEARMRIESLHFQQANAIHTIEAYEEFLRLYPRGKFAIQALNILEQLRFEKAKARNTKVALRDFLNRYPKSPFKEQTLSLLENLEFNEARQANTPEAFEYYLRRYPNGRYAPEAMSLIETLQFEKAKSANTIETFTKFLAQYSWGKHAEAARARLEELKFEKARLTHTIEAYEEFLKAYPQGLFVEEAQKRLSLLKEQIRQIELATKKALPAGAKVEVTSVSRFPQKPQFNIAAHLLEGHSADEKSPYVRGDYGTHEKLIRLVQLRCARILKSIATKAQYPEGSEIVICARHGVRQSYFGAIGGADVAMTIYEIAVPIETLKTKSLASMKLEDIIKLWVVNKNIIPSLQFQYVWF